MADQIASARQAAERKRKEKILELRKKAKDKETQDETKENDDANNDDEFEAPPPAKKPIKFRSYVPKDETLKEKKFEDTKPESVKENVKELLEKSKPETTIDEVDLTNLAPRKPDWDLKRDVSKKLEKLQRRTQRAIVEIIRERLSEGSEDLASAVNAVTEEQLS